MSKALVIIDMQPHFDHDDVVSKVINSCQKEITKAIEEHIKIVFVEFAGYGATDIRLRQLVEDYEHLSIVYKDQNDGSNEIVAELGKYYSLFRICGVYTDECVLATVEGLINLCPNLKFEIVSSAVNAYQNRNTIHCFNRMARTTVI